MRNYLNRFHDWFWKSWRDLVRIVTIIGITALALIFLQTLNSNRQLLGNQTAILEKLRQASINREKAIEDLKADNANQTVILCKLIISNRDGLKDADVQEIETICREKLKSDGIVIPPSQPSSGQTNSSTTNNNSQNNSNPVIPPPSTNPTPPPQGTVPEILDGLNRGIKQILSGLPGVN